MPVDHTKDAHSPSAWKMTNAMESWSWNGCDGNAAKVEVYTRADHVKLYINGKCVGTKKPKMTARYSLIQPIRMEKSRLLPMMQMTI